MSQTTQQQVTGNEAEVDDGALVALIPLSGALSPQAVRAGMAGPILNGPSGVVWRRTTITHVNADGAFCLYASECTAQAMWIPSGDFFIADRPSETPTRSIMDYMVSQQRAHGGPVRHGFHRSSSMNMSANVYVQRHGSGPVRNHDRSLASRPLNRHDPMARPEPRPAGMGSRRTVSRRERRERDSEVRHLLPTQTITPNSTTSNTTNQSRSLPHTTPESSSSTTSSFNQTTTAARSQPIFHKSDHTIHRVAELHLSDDDDDADSHATRLN